MATNDIGRVTPIWRGFFSAATTYELNDIVIDTAGSVWWHKSPAQTTGEIPEAGEIWDAVIDMSVFSGLIQAAITTAQTALEAAREAVGEVSADTERAETAARNAETSALNAAESAASVGAQAQAAERSAEAAADSATGAAGSAEAAARSKSDAEAYAVGTRGGEDVETTDPTYHNNAKFYSEQAESSAEAAAQSAEDAQDVLDSIPADYTQMSKDVGDLKESLNDYYAVPDTDIRRGVWRQTGISASTTRLCCVAPYDVRKNDIIKYRTINQDIGFVLYNDDFSEMLYDSGWQRAIDNGRELIIPDNGKLVFNARSIISDSTPITVEDWDSTVIIYNTVIGHVRSELYEDEKQITNNKNNISDIFDLESTYTENILSASTRGIAYSGAVGSAYSIITSRNRYSLTPPFKSDYNAVAEISVNAGFRISYRIIDDNDIIEYDSGWITSGRKVNIDKNKRYCFTGGKTSDSAISNIEEYLNNVSVTLSASFFGIMDGLNDNKIYSEPLYMYNIKSVNHRGYNTVAPENTIPAFILSKRMGFKYVETDVRFTSDGVAVLLHDKWINRTGRNADGSQIATPNLEIASITYEEALTYDFGIYMGPEYAGTKIPTLEEFVLLCKNIGLTPRIELNVLTVANAETMYNIIEKYGMQNKVEYNCNDEFVANKFLELNPTATIVWGLNNYAESTVNKIGLLKTINNKIIVNMYYTGFTAEFIAKCKQFKIEAEAWTVNVATVAQNLLNDYPYITGITSDELNISKIMFDSIMI